MTNTTTTKNPTEREILNEMLLLPDVQKSEKYTNYINKRLGQLDKKNEANRTIKDADAALMNAILNILRNAAEPMQAKDIFAVGNFITECSSNKLISMITKLVNAGKVTKTIEKRNSLFSIVEGAEDVEAGAKA